MDLKKLVELEDEVKDDIVLATPDNLLDAEEDENWKEHEARVSDTVNHPAHYTQGEIECIEVLEQLAADGHDFRILNAMKYLWRYRHKGSHESLRKAIWYIERTLTHA